MKEAQALKALDEDVSAELQALRDEENALNEAFTQNMSLCLSIYARTAAAGIVPHFLCSVDPDPCSI